MRTREFFGGYARMLGNRRVPAAPTPLAAVAAGALDLVAGLRRQESEIVDLDEGMRRTEAWLHEQRLLA